MSRKIAFIGAGTMGEALIKGMLDAGLFEKKDIIASDRNDARLKVISETYGTAIARSNAEALRFGNIIVFAVKPQNILEVLRELAPEVEPSKVIISIVAGVATRQIEALISVDQPVPVVRVMPNTPVLVKAGMSCIALGRYAKEGELALVKELFSAVGHVMEVREDMMDGVTALSGSGPAYLFAFMEALVDAGVKLGFSPEEAGTLVMNTTRGSCRLLDETDESPAVLRQKVTSPQGTTAEALAVFKEKGFSRILSESVQAAARRSKEIRESLVERMAQ